MSTQTPFKIIALSGSLRAGSYNTALLHAALELAPAGLDIEIADISDIPFYNGDVQARGFPAPLEALGAKIADADAVLFATPEYNYSVPGVLKNAIDWLSRLNPQPLENKPIGMVGASMGNMGTSRAQYHLRQILVFLNAPAMNRPEVFVGAAHTKFDEAGKLVDGDTRKFFADYLSAFEAWVGKAKALAA
ncbi:NAD(P)H-dependent oxidoreductase [Kaustia mangrovi]|uniref:NAD(P)H-dependent oxidoreductase n=1 Tax=Kaustia mangrovi TaxID=2593653 RepID=A0A7S8HCL2_9HYPH|nr:NADPH-dependent FMN reductase [Kaustia mangrovi]QPC43741.1 NAD(P)H-dependent oxidoreductase [Kaustia mangrovi]